MATVATQIAAGTPSADRVEPGSSLLHIAKLPSTTLSSSTDPRTVATDWVRAFNRAVADPSATGIPSAFLEESYWKDQLCLSWDFHTLHGPTAITSLIHSTKGSRVHSLALDTSSEIRSPIEKVFDAEGKVHVVQAFLTVKTGVGHGAGIVRLVQERGVWKAFTLYTFLTGLRGYEESVGSRRPVGVEHGIHAEKKNWLDKRIEEESFESGEEPTVLILGAGQSGLTVAARLKMLNVKTLIVDREERIGDNWRSRYHQLVLHDPVWFDHLPYLPFPDSWPIFTPKDKLGDWFESYVKLLDLNAWTRSTIQRSEWNEKKAEWTVEIERVTADGKIQVRVLKPKHIIQATGASGEPNIPSILGIGAFTGPLVHSSNFKGCTPDGQGKKVVIVGCCNSGHDIAQSYHENGYSVTMIQRSSTFVVSAATNLAGLEPLYCEGCPPTEDSDIIHFGLPNPVVKRLAVDGCKANMKRDETILTGLEKAGFKLDKGPDETGLWMKYLQRGGGYYIDVGCSQLIIERKIAIKQGHEITEVLPNGLRLDDGTELEADEIVFATGYLNMTSVCRKVFGDAVADRVQNVWGFDEEGEIRSMWRKSGHPGFWFMGGNLALCRWNSRFLALQIKGLVEGLTRYEDV